MRHLGSAAVVVATTAVAFLARRFLALPDPEMLYFAAIMVSAAFFGRGPSILAAGLSVAAYDFFFVPPFYRFTVTNPSHILTFAMMFAIGLLISSLTTRLRQQERMALRARTEEMRSALLSSVSHDLRTPLATITGSATTLRDERGLSDQTRGELVGSICDEAERLERLVTNLLEMTRIQSGEAKVEREWVPIEELVGSALGRLESRLAGRVVKTNLPDDPPLVPVDPVLIEQALINLVDNAAKYTPAESAIEISAEARAQAVEVIVADRGPGFAAGEEARIFERFYRGGTNGVAGAGLGLAICRGIVEAHGGTVVAENRPEGGALFRVILPIVGEPPAPPPREEEMRAG